MNFAYFIFLLLIIFLLLFLFKKAKDRVPKKIKPYIMAVIVLFMLRYIALLLLCVITRTGVAYYLKGFVFLNHLTIPLMIVCLAYVFSRPEKLPFSSNYIVGGILTSVYVVGMVLIKGIVNMNPNYGYIVSLDKDNILNIVSLIILGGLLIFNVMVLDKPNNNKLGVIYLIVAIFFVMIENVIHLGGLKLFPYPIIGDGIFLIIMNLAFNTFKKVK